MSSWYIEEARLLPAMKVTGSQGSLASVQPHCTLSIHLCCVMLPLGEGEPHKHAGSFAASCTVDNKGLCL